ncbi:unnamed protein product [Pylaiella littoralis]
MMYAWFMVSPWGQRCCFWFVFSVDALLRWGFRSAATRKIYAAVVGSLLLRVSGLCSSQMCRDSLRVQLVSSWRYFSTVLIYKYLIWLGQSPCQPPSVSHGHLGCLKWLF